MLQKVTVTFSASHPTLVKGHCLFSSGNAQGPQQSSFQQLCVCVQACEAKQRRVTLQKGEGQLLFSISLISSESNALYFLRSTPENKAWMIQCWGSALFQLLRHQPNWPRELSLSHSNTDKDADIAKTYKGNIYVVKKTAQAKNTTIRENIFCLWSKFDIKHFPLERNSNYFPPIAITFQSIL